MRIIVSPWKNAVRLSVVLGVTVCATARAEAPPSPVTSKTFLEQYDAERTAALREYFADPAMFLDNFQVVRDLADTTPQAAEIIKQIIHQAFSSGPHPKRGEALAAMEAWCSDGLQKGYKYVARKECIPIWDAMVHVLPFTRPKEREDRFIETIVQYASDPDVGVREEAAGYFYVALFSTDRFNPFVERFRAQAANDRELLASKNCPEELTADLFAYCDYAERRMDYAMKSYAEIRGPRTPAVSEQEFFSFRQLPFEQQLAQGQKSEVYKLILRGFFPDYNFDIAKVDAYLEAFFKNKEIHVSFFGGHADDDMGFLAEQLMDSIFEKGSSCLAMQTLKWFIDHLCTANAGDKPVYTPEVFAQSISAILGSYCRHKQAAHGKSPFELDQRVYAHCLNLLKSPLEGVRHAVCINLMELPKADAEKAQETIRYAEELLKDSALSKRHRIQLENLRRELEFGLRQK